jgi:hypothetical protein
MSGDANRKKADQPTVLATVVHKQSLLKILSELETRLVSQAFIDTAVCRMHRGTMLTGMKAQQAALLTLVPSGQTAVGAALATAARATKARSEVNAIG